MNNLETFLARNGYVSEPLRLNSTGHLILKACHNNHYLSLVLDTGTGQSCLSQAVAENMSLQLEASDDIAAGIGSSAGNEGKHIAHAKIESIKLGNYEVSRMNFAVIDFSYINEAINNAGESGIDGIIGSDLLVEHKAIIDYTTKKLFIKPKN